MEQLLKSITNLQIQNICTIVGVVLVVVGMGSGGVIYIKLGNRKIRIVRRDIELSRIKNEKPTDQLEKAQQLVPSCISVSIVPTPPTKKTSMSSFILTMP